MEGTPGQERDKPDLPETGMYLWSTWLCLPTSSFCVLCASVYMTDLPVSLRCVPFSEALCESDCRCTIVATNPWSSSRWGPPASLLECGTVPSLRMLSEPFCLPLVGSMLKPLKCSAGHGSLIAVFIICLVARAPLFESKGRAVPCPSAECISCSPCSPSVLLTPEYLLSHLISSSASCLDYGPPLLSVLSSFLWNILLDDSLSFAAWVTPDVRQLWCSQVRSVKHTAMSLGANFKTDPVSSELVCFFNSSFLAVVGDAESLVSSMLIWEALLYNFVLNCFWRYPFSAVMWDRHLCGHLPNW